MRFTKMHGLGNDYLYVWGEAPENVSELSVKLSDRHFGAGSDGMIFISPSRVADFKMRIFNADGSEAMMCGNGIRCVGKYVYDKGFTYKEELTVETLSGIKTLSLKIADGKVESVSVGMGRAGVGEESSLDVDGERIDYVPVSVGNPHAVVFVGDADSVPLPSVGPKIEKNKAFPGGVNAEFVTPLSDTRLRMRVWERGSGITMACGTGACASVAAAVSRGFCRAGVPVTVALDGGELTVTVSKSFDVTMRGPAVTIYEGDAEI